MIWSVWSRQQRNSPAKNPQTQINHSYHQGSANVWLSFTIYLYNTYYHSDLLNRSPSSMNMTVAVLYKNKSSHNFLLWSGSSFSELSLRVSFWNTKVFELPVQPTHKLLTDMSTLSTGCLHDYHKSNMAANKTHCHGHKDVNNR